MDGASEAAVKPLLTSMHRFMALRVPVVKSTDGQFTRRDSPDTRRWFT